MNEDDEFRDFLKGPLLKQAIGAADGLETYDKHWRPGAQIYGFRDAAAILAGYVIESGGHTSSTLFHPILYLYRHSIELQLKKLIKQHQGSAPTGHGIWQLWTALREIALRYGVGPALEDLERRLQELHQIDPNGVTFRYATTSKGDFIAIGPSEVDVAHLRRQMDHIDIALSGLATELEQAVDVSMELSR